MEGNLVSAFISSDDLRRSAHQQPTEGVLVAPATGRPLTPFPMIVAVETVSMCNAACAFCPHPASGKNEHQEVMSDGVFDMILTECATQSDLRVFNLSFQNEPLLDPHLFDLLRTARSALQPGVAISLVTNGSLLRGRKLQALLADPPDLLKISVTGIDVDTYEQAMKNLRFHVTLNNIERLLELVRDRDRPQVVINCVMTAAMETIGIRKIRAFWAERGATLHVMNLENRAGALPAEYLTANAGPQNLRAWCKRPEEQLSIWPNGDVALCCADWTKQVVLGNVRTHSLQEIWRNETIGRYRDALRRGRADTLSPCDHCTAAEVSFEGRTYTELGQLAENL
jgi:radical SAM protein with 4Fe4S-binding SPASM domain